jgi:hypothetical protein
MTSQAATNFWIAVAFFFGVAVAQSPYYSVTPTYRASWYVNEQNETITISVSVDAACWVGIGWHCMESSCNETYSKMTEADFAIALFNADGSLDKVIDGVASREKNGFKMPPSDIEMNGTNDFFDVRGYQTKQPPFTTFTFTRKFVTKDFNDHKWMNTTTRFIWAHGNLEGKNDPNTFGFHGDYADVFQINLFLAPEQQQSTAPADDTAALVAVLITYHGSLMVFGFAFCMSFGIFVARNLKAYKWWFSLHIILQVIGAMSVFTAFGLIIWAKIAGEYPHFASVHSRFGLSTLLVVFLNVIMGVVADRMFEPSRTKVPFFPDKVHWWLGRSIFGLAMATIILGMFRHQLATEVIVVFFIVIGLKLFLYFFVDIKKWLSGDIDYEQLNNENEALLVGNKRTSVNFR